MEFRRYKYRLYPSYKQKIRLNQHLNTCKIIYNDLLALSIDCYKFGNISLNKFDFNNYLSKIKYNLHSHIKQNVSDRIHKALQNFYRRNKDISCRKKGFPRYKCQVNSFSYSQTGYKLLSNKRLHLSKIGNIPIILHRIPKGKIKTLTIKQNNAGQWYAIFTCEIYINIIKHPSTKKVGIDMGLENLMVFSNGKFIDNPRYLIKSEQRLKLLDRRFSRKNKKSYNQKKSYYKLTKQYLKVCNQRMDFLHKLSNNITKSYSFIVIEDLNIKEIIEKYWLGKSINDASWGFLIKNIEYKAVKCGSEFIKVDPRNTSKTCSKCGTITEMPLSKRQFLCPHCSFTCHRDLNAAYNILKVGMDYAELNACGHNVRPSLKAVVVEAGTIYNKS